MSNKGVLQQELDFYQKQKQEYIKLYKGQFILIKEQNLIGTFTTDAEAYKAGVEHFGNQPFLIKQALADDTTVSYPALTVGMINATI